MSASVLVLTLAGRQVAIDTAAVNSVVELGALTPVPRAPQFIIGLAALRSRTLTAIDSRAALGLPPTARPLARGQRAIITEIGGHSYAVLVEDVAGISSLLAEPAPVIGQAGPGWDRIALGVGETPLGAVLVIDLAALVAGPPAMAA